MIPKNWDEVSVDLFVKLYPTFKTGEMTDMEIIDNKVKQLSLIKGISLEQAELCTTSEANKVKLLLDTPLPTKIVKYFSLPRYKTNLETGEKVSDGKTTYRFNIDANELNSSGYVGIMNAIKEDPIKNMHATLFNLATPVYSLWRLKSYEFSNAEVGDRMEEFKQMPISIAYPIAVFFLNLSKALIPVTEDYLMESLMKMEKELEETKADLLDTDGQ